MKKALYILGFIILTFLVIVTGVYFFFETKVKNEILPTVKKTIKKKSKLNIDFEEFHFSFAQLLKLEPSISIKKLTIEDAISIEKAYVRVYLRTLLNKEFDIKEILIDKALIRLEEDARKQVSLKGIKLPKPDPKKDTNNTLSDYINDIELKSLVIKNSTIEYYIYKTKKPIVIYNIKAKLEDLNISANNKLAANIEFSANIFGSNSHIKGNGTLGPIPLDFSTLPIKGNAKTVIMVKDMQSAELRKLLGPLVRIDSDTKIKHIVNFTGDLVKGIGGAGTLELKDLNIGAPTNNHSLEINSSIPHSFFMTMTGEPQLVIDSKNSQVEIKSQNSKVGKLNFNVHINQNPITGYVSGYSTGNLSGLDIEETLNCFTPYRKLISGIFEISNYNLSFAGSNVKSNGHIVIRDGSLYILKSITKYKDIANALISNGGTIAEKLGGTFATLSSDFNYDGANIYNENLKLIADKVSVVGNGSLLKDQSLHYDLRLLVSTLNPIPIKIRGTVAKPVIKPDLRQFGKEQGKKVTSTALQYGLLALKQAASGNGKEAKTTVNSAIKQIGKTLATNGTTLKTTKNGQVLINKQSLKQLGSLLQTKVQQTVQTQVGIPTQSANGTATSASPSNPQQP